MCARSTLDWSQSKIFRVLHKDSALFSSWRTLKLLRRLYLVIRVTVVVTAVVLLSFAE